MAPGTVENRMAILAPAGGGPGPGTARGWEGATSWGGIGHCPEAAGEGRWNSLKAQLKGQLRKALKGPVLSIRMGLFYKIRGFYLVPSPKEGPPDSWLKQMGNRGGPTPVLSPLWGLQGLHGPGTNSRISRQDTEWLLLSRAEAGSRKGTAMWVGVILSRRGQETTWVDLR